MADVRISALPAGVANVNAVVPATNAAGTLTEKVKIGDIAALGSAKVFTGSATPTATKAGDLWLKPTTGGSTELSVWTGTAWVAVSGGSSTLVSATAPAGPHDTGTLWVTPETATDPATISFWNGTAWEAIAGGALPDPDSEGFLRADTANSQWVISRPVVVDTVQPNAFGVGDLWIDPTATPPEFIYSNANPPVSVDPPVMETASDPLGVVNGVYVEPDVVGAVPVVVDGRRYLLPLLEAPASVALRAPLFTFADAPVKQQLDGSWIGFDNTGNVYTQPDTVAAVPVMVAGKKYLLPLLEE